MLTSFSQVVRRWQQFHRIVRVSEDALEVAMILGNSREDPSFVSLESISLAYDSARKVRGLSCQGKHQQSSTSNA